VEVFENQDGRLPVCYVPEDQTHPLEELEVVGRSRRLAIAWPEFGKQTSQLAPDGQRHGLEPFSVLPHAPSSQGVHPGAERQDLLAFVAASDQHSGTVRGNLCCQFRDESCLANAGFADEGNHATPPADGLRERRSQSGHLLVAPDEGRVPGQDKGRAPDAREGARPS
jgi:hypothetical protein